MEFKIEEATAADWPLIEERSEETVWQDLVPYRQEELDRKGLGRRVRELLERLRGERLNQAFVARDEEGRFAGYIWLAESSDYLAGQQEAHVIDIYVEEGYRRRGLGRTFLQLAERWAKERGYRFIALSVAAHNRVARTLYKKAGYREEWVGMGKRVG